MINISDSLKELIDMLEDTKDKWIILALTVATFKISNEIDEETINKIKQLISEGKK